MRNFFTFLALALVLSLWTGNSQLHAQCSPDASQTTPGLTPAELQPAVLNQAIADQVLTVVLQQELDSTVTVPVGGGTASGDVKVWFTEFDFTGVANNFANLNDFSQACNNPPNCTYTYTLADTGNNPALERACFTVSGTPTAGGDVIDTLYLEALVDGYLEISVSGLPVPIPPFLMSEVQQQTALLALYPDAVDLVQGFRNFRYPVVLSVDDPNTAQQPTSPTSTSEALAQELELSLSPNPVTTQAVLAYTLAQPAQITVNLMDLQGRSLQVLQQGRQQAGRQQIRIQPETLNLSAGVYLVQLQLNDQQLTRKLLVR